MPLKPSTDPRIRLVAVSLSVTLLVMILRLVAYIVSGSLAVLADAFHSATDIAAGLIALAALRASSKAPDREHMYGHGKAESLGVLGMSLLLIAVMLYIFYEGLLRILAFSAREVLFTPITASLLLATLLMDYWRSRALERGALNYSSQVLAADALHYKSDLYSTLTVIGINIYGLSGFGEGYVWIVDMLASFAIALYFARSGLRLSRSAIDDLMDRAPLEPIKIFSEVCDKAGARVKSVRARKSGSRIFIDAVVELPASMGLEEAHKISDEIEDLVRRSLKCDVDMVIHMEPRSSAASEDLKRLSEKAAMKIPGVLGVHDIEIFRDSEGYHVRMHVEVSPSMSLSEAQRLAAKVERAVRESSGAVKSALVHAEPKRAETPDLHRLVDRILSTNKDLSGLVRLKSLRATYIGDRIALDLSCSLAQDMSVEAAHEAITRLEAALREELGSKAIITIRYAPEHKTQGD